MVKNETCSYLSESYFEAKSRVCNSGYEDEIKWQENISPYSFDESDLLRESAWVILCSGFNESVLRKKFSYISLCFYDWESAELIVKNRKICRETALSGFRNSPKIDAIIATAAHLNENSFSKFKQEVINDPVQALRQFPFIGPVTVYHLAKNLGFPVAKPDRHLVRIAKSAGFSDVQDFCKTVSVLTSDPIQVVDIVFWRFATLVKNYEEFFQINYVGRNASNIFMGPKVLTRFGFFYRILNSIRIISVQLTSKFKKPLHSGS